MLLFILGAFTVPDRISPPVIFLTPPEKLVLEVRTIGGYSTILWSRDAKILESLADPTLHSEFTHFKEIFVREPTNSSDYGIYHITYLGSRGTDIIVIPTGMCFFLLSYYRGYHNQNVIEMRDNFDNTGSV